MLVRKPTSPRVSGNSSTAASHTGDTSETILGFCDIPANALGIDGGVKIDVLWSAPVGNGSSANAVLRIAAGAGGSTSGTAFISTTLTPGQVYRHLQIICNNHVANAQFGPQDAGGVGILGTALKTSAIDTTAAWTISLNGTLASGADTITLKHFDVQIIG